MFQIKPRQTAEIVLGKKPKVRWIPFNLTTLEFTISTKIKAIPICPIIHATTR